ncbi:MAG: hypothetical protein ACXV98_12175 [Ilumatobacteraceae bacterium]
MPSQNRPTWGPPRGRPVTAHQASARQTGRQPTARQATASPSPRRRHPAARARRLVGWATVATSAAIVGYMVTADAQQPSSQRVVTPVVQEPAVQQPAVQEPPVQLPAVTPTNGDDSAAAPVVTQPSIPVATPPAVTKHHRQVSSLPNSSTHGS